MVDKRNECVILFKRPKCGTKGERQMVDTLKLKARMVEKGYTQRSLAAKMKRNKDTINAKLNGKANFDTEEILMMCEILEISDPVEKVLYFLS